MRNLIKIISLIFLITILYSSCDRHENEDCGCPELQLDIPSSPYDDPVWHPNGETIGFNYTPIKEIHYYAGKECPYQAEYVYDYEKEGFYLMDKDGNNIRRVLPFTLNTPSWSPDGTKIAFANGARISIMPFDGQEFDVDSIITYDFPGRNFSPNWSFDGRKIAFTQSICDETACGLWIYSFNTGVLEHIKDIYGDHDWHSDGDSLIFDNRTFNDKGSPIKISMYVYDYETQKRNLICELLSPHFENRYLKFSSSGKFIAFISLLKTGGVQLFRINSSGSDLKQLTTAGCTNYDWSPDGKKIVYVNFKDWNIDKTIGVLWIMDADGSNKKPLTYNDFKESY